MTQSGPHLAVPLAVDGLVGRTPRIAVVSASSDIAPSGPRRCAIGGGEVDRWRYTPERASRHTRQTAAKPYDLPVTGDMTRLMACACVGQKGGRPPEGRSSRAAGRARSAPPRVW